MAFAEPWALPRYCGGAADRILNDVWHEFGNIVGLPSAGPSVEPVLAKHLEAMGNSSMPGFAISHQEFVQLLTIAMSQREAPTTRSRELLCTRTFQHHGRCARCAAL